MHVQRKLRKLASNITGTNLGITLGPRRNDFAAAVLHLRLAAGLIPVLDVEAHLLAHLRTDPMGFVTTLTAWSAGNRLPFLATMVVNENPQVRAQAAYSLVEHADRFPADKERAHAVLQTALSQDEGCSLRDALALAIAEYPDEEFVALAAELRIHPSAVIRSRFVEDQ